MKYFTLLLVVTLVATALGDCHSKKNTIDRVKNSSQEGGSSVDTAKSQANVSPDVNSQLIGQFARRTRHQRSSGSGYNRPSNQGSYGSQDGYGNQGGYGSSQGGYGNQGNRGNQGGYGNSGYGSSSQGGYGNNQGGYGSQGGYGNQGSNRPSSGSSGYGNSGYGNSGYGNSGYGSSG